MGLIPIYTWTKGIRNFDHRRKAFRNQPWAQGVVLLACVVVAMLLANLPFTKGFYHDFLNSSITLFLSAPSGNGVYFPHGMTVESFVNDILMTIFFFTVGLEIRREMKVGELSTVKKALMPVIAAFGGVVAPALIFTLVNHGTAAPQAGESLQPPTSHLQSASCPYSATEYRYHSKCSSPHWP